MTFTQLRCFIEVARQLNFARAAETLYISQPAVSARSMHWKTSWACACLTAPAMWWP